MIHDKNQDKARISMPFFYNPSIDAVLEGGVCYGLHLAKRLQHALQELNETNRKQKPSLKHSGGRNFEHNLSRSNSPKHSGSGAGQSSIVENKATVRLLSSL